MLKPGCTDLQAGADDDLAVVQARLQALRTLHRQRGLKPAELALANKLAQLERLLLAARAVSNYRI